MESIGDQIRTRRERAGLTQVQLAAKCGLFQGAISDIENGKRPHMHYTTVQRILEALDALEAQSSSQTSVGES